MIIRELIEKLQSYPTSTEVFITNVVDGDRHYPIVDIQTQGCTLNIVMSNQSEESKEE
ncbi:MAG: hypothetical protein V7L21_26315 [Nostoc sp.]|uniref:hypothetical protein n=1 Tax=unclassified Nostoc TaxID=2593658 RepID=UPI0025FC325E|nr:hypothetical protein [Nostoc sp. NMS9]MBN3942995.1 hypothetical protein [Nostoc sp. NMS9]